MKLESKEVIDCYGYRDIYESSYDIKTPDFIPPGKIIFVEACYIRQFFEALKNQPHRKVVVISAESDYGIHYQAEAHSNEDIFKAYYRVKWNEVSSERNHYIRLNFIGAEAEHCCPTDKFSAKIDGMTACTFSEIPQNVIHWFCANCSINEPRVSFLPFGVNSQGDVNLFDVVCKEKIEAPKKLFYINLDTNTYDRYEYKNFWAKYIEQPGVSDWATFIQETVPVKEFYEQIRDHEFICCHAGNGQDCFRNYETMYLARFPLIKYSRFGVNMLNADFPVTLVKNWYAINKTSLETVHNHILESNAQVNWEVLKKSYWFDKIHHAAKDI